MTCPRHPYSQTDARSLLLAADMADRAADDLLAYDPDDSEVAHLLRGAIALRKLAKLGAPESLARRDDDDDGSDARAEAEEGARNALEMAGLR